MFGKTVQVLQQQALFSLPNIRLIPYLPTTRILFLLTNAIYSHLGVVMSLHSMQKLLAL